MLIRMKFSFSSLAVVLGWPFVVVTFSFFFFFLLLPLTAFGILLNYSRLTLPHRRCLLGVGKLRTAAGLQGAEHEPTCSTRPQY